MLTKDTEPLPAIDDNGGIAYVMTPLTGGDQFIDLPRPVQALQLCTVLLAGTGFGIAATDVEVAVSLRDDADTALAVPGPDAVAIAEKLVPLLTG